MEVLYLIIPLSILLVILIAWIFIWAVKSGQFDDLEGPAHRVIMDEDTEPGPRQPADEQARKPSRHA